MNRQIQSNGNFVSLILTFLISSTAFAADNQAAAEKPLIKTTHVYKTVGDVKVEADVYRPVVVWIHGAGFRGVAKVP